jgi:hypothetical protein
VVRDNLGEASRIKARMAIWNQPMELGTWNGVVHGFAYNTPILRSGTN